MKNNKPSLLTKEDLLILLQNTSNLRTGTDQVVWSIFGAFWGTNALLLISLFSTNENLNFNTRGIIVSIIGILISIVWLLIQSRALDRIKMLENSMTFIEKDLKLPKELCTYSRKPIVSNFIKIRARTVMRLCPNIVLLLWIASLAVFICSS